MSIKEGGTFETFRDPNGNVLASINRDGSVLAQAIDFGDGTVQTTAAAGGGAVASVFGRTGAVVAATNDYSFSQINGVATVAQIPNPIHTTVTTVTHAQILALNVTPVAVTPITAGHKVLPLQISMSFLYGGVAPYNGSGTLVFFHTDTFAGSGFRDGSVPEFLQVASSSTQIPGYVEAQGSTSVQTLGPAGSPDQILLKNTGSAFTAGNSSNSLIVTVTYQLVDPLTGLTS
jgi:hypothetical protein